MSVAPWLFLLAYMGVTSVYDIRTRTIPNWIPIVGIGVGIVGGWVGWWHWSYLWMILIAVPLLIADVGKGDVKASTVLGGLFGAWSSALLLVAFGLLIPFVIAYRMGWSRYPETWPFFPLLCGAACAILLVGWV